MKLLKLFFCIGFLFTIETTDLLSVKQISNFPHHLDKPFNIEIVSSSEDEKLSTDSRDTMVVRIFDKFNLKEDRVLFYYGFQDSIEEEFKGTFMKILLLEKSVNKTKINLSILFKRNSNKKLFEIYTFSASTKLQRKNILNNLKQAKCLFKNNIDLYLPAKIKFSILPTNVTRKEILLDDLIVASCRSYDGIPQKKPTFSYPEQINVTETKYSRPKNELIIYFPAQISTHLTTLSCQAGNVTNSITIHVLHHPTSIFVDPENYQVLEADFTIKCFSKDGYPSPIIKWEFIQGPENASQYFDIKQNETVIYMNKNSPTKSFWIFNCSMRSYVNNNENILMKSVNVSIANHPSQLFIEPIITKRMRVNSTISCFVKDGYPYPEIKWKLIQGPPNAFLLYNITDNGSKLFINTNNLPGSIWKFRCVMKSILSKTTKTMNQTISFIIAKNPDESCNEKCINSRISEMEESIVDNNKLHHDLNQLKQIINKLSENVDKFTENMEIWKRNTNNDIINLKESLEQKQDEMVTELKINLEQLNQTMNIWETNTKTDISNLKEISIINKGECKNQFKQLNKTIQIVNEESKDLNNRIKTTENKMIKKFFIQHTFNNRYDDSSPLFELASGVSVKITMITKRDYNYYRSVFHGFKLSLFNQGLSVIQFDISSICTIKSTNNGKIFVFHHNIKFTKLTFETDEMTSKEIRESFSESNCHVECLFLYLNL